MAALASLLLALCLFVAQVGAQLVTISKHEQGLAATTLPDLAVGESVRFMLTLEGSTGTYNVISDITYNNNIGQTATFKVDSAIVASIDAQITTTNLNELDDASVLVANEAIRFDFGSCTFASTASIILNVTGRFDEAALDTSRGHQAVLQASTTFGGSNVVESDQVTVVEPELNVSRTTTLPVGNDGASVDAGDVYAFTATIDHAVVSDAPAYDVVYRDDVGWTMSVESGSVTCTITGAGTEDCSGDVSFVGSTVELVLSRGLLVTEQVNLA
ncbi:uncharacterized protein MONBRDRAFT_30270 [Monosiga brevicollis MX1]|uniref:Uncharacterized protein n=1 Tax=Monosiga brevicollis TaxID=81824 RepID=A9VDH3_MONBE|nr:uncharacterized protein MONBRDRAFT_30270 [Monosiga brevicollis MX1]EDQ84392.1 predicted protein [Monosiga brevicollis MX1]|eukprot:XP_001750793.1 hypothetical protein [Monosiga brevicollis MX1]